MVARCQTVAFRGVDVVPVDVQVQVGAGLPAFAVVGLADKAVAESRERVRGALLAMGLSLPAKRITVNLSPADLAKEGSHFDLPIALAVLVAMQVIPQDAIAEYVVLGELALDGAILPVDGVLPAAIGAQSLQCGLICPETNGAEATWAGDFSVLAPANVLSLINHFRGLQVLTPPSRKLQEAAYAGPDLAEVKGQETARRVLEIAAAGGHNLLMSGPPGSGKSLLAACLPGILPKLSPEEMLEVSMVHSVAGQLSDGKLTRSRPYRSPHHSASMAAMVGGGKRARPGEISLAHRGVLFLDELPEFPRAVLESLRQPLENGTISVARVQAHVTYPAEFQLVAAMNPCRCGYVADAARACNKAPRCADDYQNRLSGPLLDRFDLFVDVPAQSPLVLLTDKTAEPSAAVAHRVAEARQRQLDRNRKLTGRAVLNSRLSGDELIVFALADPACRKMLTEAESRLNLSMRGMTRVLRLACTLADMDGLYQPGTAQLAEALSYRLHLGKSSQPRATA